MRKGTWHCAWHPQGGVAAAFCNPLCCWPARLQQAGRPCRSLLQKGQLQGIQPLPAVPQKGWGGPCSLAEAGMQRQLLCSSKVLPLQLFVLLQLAGAGRRSKCWIVLLTATACHVSLQPLGLAPRQQPPGRRQHRLALLLPSWSLRKLQW